MGRIERPTKKGWAVKSAGMSSDAGGVVKKAEVDEARVGSMVLAMCVTTLLSAVGVARVAGCAERTKGISKPATKNGGSPLWNKCQYIIL
jgi:hypothetical protein